MYTVVVLQTFLSLFVCPPWATLRTCVSVQLQLTAFGAAGGGGHWRGRWVAMKTGNKNSGGVGITIEGGEGGEKSMKSPRGGC